jgi:hypothetical protein
MACQAALARVDPTDRESASFNYQVHAVLGNLVASVSGAENFTGSFAVFSKVSITGKSGNVSPEG